MDNFNTNKGKVIFYEASSVGSGNDFGAKIGISILHQHASWLKSRSM
ncbi:MAG: hypothetical protein AEth_00338 [Candidatus Argoarchaeum ethanivorans]|uniref:Uncharacterized protein n=1 Tax=Candidatus Argoarchaeum ethanivorans TaxID=2608793 RepID=A0A8B3S4Q7_9EURY|nr:MAG: hypothetical protein AEth_00338 [Candidatus Argoarchaeum ethanivorans]